MNNKIGSAKLTGSIFLAVILIAGTIATILPSTQAAPFYENEYETEYPPYSQDYEPRDYPSDNSYYKFKDSNVILNKIKCNNINSNNNGVDVNLGRPNNDALVEAQAADNEGQATTSNGEGYNNGYKQNDNGFKFVCINNNDNENSIVINETTTVPTIPPDTITCEECFEETLSPLAFAQLNAFLAEGQITITIGGEMITPRSLTELCEALQDATALEIFEIFNSLAGGDRAINIIFCLGAAFGFDTTALQ